MIKKGIVAMLAVAVLSLSTVNAFAAEAGVDAVLVGEALMRRTDRRAALDELKGDLS